jgi:hypothetical protein
VVSAGASPTNSRSTCSRTPHAVTRACEATQATTRPLARSLAPTGSARHGRE